MQVLFPTYSLPVPSISPVSVLCTKVWHRIRYVTLHCTLEIRADKGWAVKRARPSKKVWCSGLGLCLEMSPVSTSVRACDVVCPLDIAAVTESWRLELFSCTSSSFLWAATLSSRGKCCWFGRFSWIYLNYIFVLLLANVEVIPQQKQVKAV